MMTRRDPSHLATDGYESINQPSTGGLLAFSRSSAWRSLLMPRFLPATGRSLFACHPGTPTVRRGMHSVEHRTLGSARALLHVTDTAWCKAPSPVLRTTAIAAVPCALLRRPRSRSWTSMSPPRSDRNLLHRTTRDLPLWWRNGRRSIADDHRGRPWSPTATACEGRSRGRTSSSFWQRRQDRNARRFASCSTPRCVSTTYLPSGGTGVRGGHQEGVWDHDRRN